MTNQHDVVTLEQFDDAGWIRNIYEQQLEKSLRAWNVNLDAANVLTLKESVGPNLAAEAGTSISGRREPLHKVASAICLMWYRTNTVRTSRQVYMVTSAATLEGRGGCECCIDGELGPHDKNVRVV